MPTPTSQRAGHRGAVLRQQHDDAAHQSARRCGRSRLPSSRRLRARSTHADLLRRARRRPRRRRPRHRARRPASRSPSGHRVGLGHDATSVQVLGSCGQQRRGRPGPSASSSEWVPTAAIRPPASSATRSASSTVDAPVRHHQRGGAAAAPGAAPARPAPRCARPARTAGRRAPAPAAGRAPPGPARAAAAARRTATGPARRPGCPGPTAGRATKSAWATCERLARPRPRSASGRPRVRFSRTLTENSVGSSKATATSRRSWASGRSRTSVPSSGDPRRRSRRTAGGPAR